MQPEPNWLLKIKFKVLPKLSPIDKFVDHGFTASSKGLLTLFLVGLIKHLLGVKFVGTEISIPWFPKINLEHLERLSYLYWGLVIYAICRYILANSQLIKEILQGGLAWGLQNTFWGKQFVYKFLLDKNTYYTISQDKNSVYNVIKIETYEDPDTVTEVFKLCYDINNTMRHVEVVMHPAFSTAKKYLSDQELNDKHWGLSIYRGPDINPEDDYIYYYGHTTSFRVRRELELLMLYSTFLSMTRDLRTLDLLFPLIALVGLAIATFA